MAEKTRYDIHLVCTTPLHSIRFPSQPADNLVEFCHGKEIVAYIDYRGIFKCFDRAKLKEVLKNVPEALRQAKAFDRELCENELKDKYPWLYNLEEGR